MKKVKVEHLRISVSSACNLECSHCYVPIESRTDSVKYLRSLISIDRIVEFLDRLLEDYGLNKISISGGEPLLRMNFERTKRLLNYARDNNLRVQLNTNGCGDVSLAELASLMGEKLNLVDFHVSLDGDNSEIVDSFRGRPNVFDSVINFLETFVEGGANVKVRYTVTEGNKNNVIPTYKIVREIGVKAFLIKPIFPTGTTLNNKSLLLTKEEYKQVQIELANESVGWSTSCDYPQPVYFTKNECHSDANVNLLKCNCGSSAMYLSDDGDLYPCTYMVGASDAKNHIIGNITDDFSDIETVWNNNDKYADYRDENKKCPSYDILNALLTMKF